ncbi:MAG: hypothetical protein ACEQSR_01505 [Candidatus Methylacidiphilales bacterium]
MKVKILDHPKLKPVAIEIISSLNITEMQYNSYLVQKGTMFLAQVVQDAYYYRLLLDSKAYWAWFINQFTITDKAVLETGVPDEVEYLRFSINGVSKISLLQYWQMQHENVNLTKMFVYADLLTKAETEFIANKVKERV